MAKPIALAAFDSFKGTAGAAELCGAAARGLADAVTTREHPLSDGGDGFGEVLAASGELRQTLEVGTVDALGRAVIAQVPLLATSEGLVAIVESARACGLAIVGGAAGNDPLAASTRGVGDMVLAAVRAGVGRIVVGCGGSATTDGGRGALEVLAAQDLGRASIEVAVDVATVFTDAALRFAPQKGASTEQVGVLTDRLQRLAIDYAEAYATLVDRIPGSGAAGGLAGGLAALGARIVSGFELVAELTELSRDLEGCELLLTGEGRLDATSLEGKVVVPLARMAPETTPVVVFAGSAEPGCAEALNEACGRPVEVIDLSATYGEQRCLEAPGAVLEEAVRVLAGAGKVTRT